MPISSKKIKIFFILLILFPTISACSMMPSWLGSDDEEKLPGERIAVILNKNNIQPSSELNVKVTLPDAKTNTSFSETETDQANPSLPTKINKSDEIDIGSSIPDGYRLASSPVIADGKIFTVDGEGNVNAYNIKEFRNPLWTKKVLQGNRFFLSGGLNFFSGKLYITSADGHVFCLNADTGEEMWKRDFNIPLRSPPVIKNNIVIFTTIQNETYGVDSNSGTTIWNHAGVSEEAGIIGSAAPFATNSVAIIPLSSGEVFALDLKTGVPVWSDSLLTKTHSANTGLLIGDINATPVQYKDMVILGSSQNLLSVKEIETGKEIWEKNISILRTPWVAGDFIYVLGAQDELMCIYAPDGRIKWITPLQKYENEEEKKNKISYTAPIIAGGRLIIASSNGYLIEVSPQDGGIISKIDIPENIFLRPAVGDNTLFLLDNSARLHIYK